jgi:hypothetical protein
MVDRRTIVAGLGALATSVAAMAAETRGNRTSEAHGATRVIDGLDCSTPSVGKLRADGVDCITKPLFGVIYADDYAIDPTGVTDSAAGLNLAIQDAITQKKKLVLPTGIFLLNAPLLCFAPGTVCKLDIEGQGFSVPSGRYGLPSVPLAPYAANTVLCINSKVVPALIYQGNRFSTLKNLAIMGLNTAASEFSPNPPTDNRSSYITADCAAGYQSPYAGIAIDPFTATAPADGGYSGLSAQYGPSPSGTGCLGLYLENVLIEQFVVGIANSTAGCSQGDTMRFKNFVVQYCDTAYACGNSQAKSNIIEGLYANFCRQVFDTLNYGRPGGNGGGACNPIAIDNCHAVEVYRIFALDDQTPCTVKSYYAESLKTLGQFGLSSGGNHCPIVFEGCQFVIREATPSFGPPPPLFFESYGPTVFKACSIGNDLDASDAWNVILNGAGGGFEQCDFAGTSYPGLPPYVGIDFNAENGCHLRDCYADSGAGIVRLTEDYLRSYGIAFNSAIGRLCANWQTKTVTDGNLTYSYQPPLPVPYIGCTTSGGSITVGTTAYAITAITQAASAVVTLSTVSLVNPFAVGQLATFASAVMTQINGLVGQVIAVGGVSGAWTVTVSINSTAFTAYSGSAGTATQPTLAFTEATLGEVQVNDILLWLMLPQGYSLNGWIVPAWKVISVNTSTGACVAYPLWDINQYDTAANMAASVGANAIEICLHQWAPTAAMTGTTATDTTLTSVSPAALLNGDWVTGAGIPTNTRVVSGGGTANLVLSKATTASATGVRLYHGRLLVPTTTVAF